MASTEFKIKGLNQEKNLNIISKKYKINELKRHSKNCSSFKVSFFQAKKVKKLLLSFGYEILEEKNYGVLPNIIKTLGNIYILSAIIVSFVVYLAQSPIIWRYELLGEENLTQAEVVGFVKENFTKKRGPEPASQVLFTFIDACCKRIRKDRELLPLSILHRGLYGNGRLKDPDVLHRRKKLCHLPA